MISTIVAIPHRMVLATVLVCISLMSTQVAAGPAVTVYVGTYAARTETGIHVCRLDMQTGALEQVGAVSGIKNPSFQALHPSGRYLYSVSESADFRGGKTGSVSAYAVAPKTGMLRLLNEQSSLGPGPCHVTTDHAGRFALVANYSGGSVAMLPIAVDGSLDKASCFIQHRGASIHPKRQTSPHAHCITVDAHDRFVMAADLGLDKVLIYRLVPETSKLEANPAMPAVSVTAGAGPRHFAFHPSGKFGYVINELQSTITAFAYDSQRGTLAALQELSTLPADFSGQNTTAEIVVAPDGKHLYGSNRGHDSIAIFSIDPRSGTLALVGHQSTLGGEPRNFAIDPTGSFLLAANQRTDNVVVFRIDPETGTLRSGRTAMRVTKPVCITFFSQQETPSQR